MSLRNFLWDRRCVYLLTWDRFEYAVRSLYECIAESHYKPDTILSIARGGLVPGLKIAHLFDIPHFEVLCVRHNTTSDMFPERNTPQVCWSNIASLEHSQVLIVDDIVGSGETMQIALDLARRCEPAAIRTASLVFNKHGARPPDYFTWEVDDWVIFPWESVHRFREEASSRHLSIREL